MRRNEFESFCRDLTDLLPRQGARYLRSQGKRLWATYQDVAALLPSGGKFASAGAGAAYVEAALVRSHGAKGVVIDFPAAVEATRDYYAKVDLHPIGVDLSSDVRLEEHAGDDFDLVFSCEIVEHLPVPPAQHFAKLIPLLRPGGRIVVTTPNAGSVRSVIKTLFHRPTLPDAEYTFSAVSFDNEWVHRREYMPVEIIKALDSCGCAVRSKHYILYGNDKLSDRLFGPVETLVPPFRPAVTIVAERR